MPSSGFRGISYPFRINKQGGVMMSTTNKLKAPHIEESIRQILNTAFLERPMESEFYSNLNLSLFEPNDESLQQVIKSQIVDALERLEERIELDEGDIELFSEVESDGNFLYATISFKVTKYETWYTTTVKVGEINE